MNRGFTLIEVIISITIIGIITGIMLPSFKNYSKVSDDLVIKEKTLIIQNEVMTFINSNILNHNQTYPIIGTSSTTYLNTNNISALELKTFVRGAMTASKVLDISTFVSVTNQEFSGFSDGIGYMICTINYKSGEKVNIEFQISDNQLNYKDVAVIYSVEYCSENGSSYKAFM